MRQFRGAVWAWRIAGPCAVVAFAGLAIVQPFVWIHVAVCVAGTAMAWMVRE